MKWVLFGSAYGKDLVFVGCGGPKPRQTYKYTKDLAEARTFNSYGEAFSWLLEKTYVAGMLGDGWNVSLRPVPIEERLSLVPWNPEEVR